MTRAEIKTVFSSGNYLKDKHTHAACFWAPLNAFYTGMRREEIAQLHVEDICKHTDDEGKMKWVIHVRKESAQGAATDKRLKNRNAKRVIPVHQDLIRIGLLAYHERIVGKHTRFFPEFNKSGNSYGKQIGKQFSSLLKKAGIKTKKKAFHSLRHSFRDQFKKKGMYNPCFSEVFGHASGEASVTSNYGGSFTPTEKYDEVIDHLNYPIGIEMLGKSKFVKGEEG